MKLSIALKGIAQVKNDFDITDVCCDSRKVKQGSLFVAVTGFKTDGHSYVKMAEDKGAVAAVVERIVDGVNIPQIVVENSRKALATASSNFFGNPEKDLKVIGVTGTNGKTTTTTLIKQVLESLGHKCGLIGTNVNMIGFRNSYGTYHSRVKRVF